MKTIEVNLGVGMNMFFTEPMKIVIDDTFEKRYKKYLKFVKTMEEPDYDYLTEDTYDYQLREFTFEEFIQSWESNILIKKHFK